MPRENEHGRYEEDAIPAVQQSDGSVLPPDVVALLAAEREERFRVALLNELAALVTAIEGLDSDGFRVRVARPCDE